MRRYDRIAGFLLLALFGFLGIRTSVQGLDLDPYRVGFWPGHRSGRAESVVCSGDYAFVAANTILVVDLRDKTNPKVVAGYGETDQVAGGLALAGNLLYAGRGTEGLVILDVSIPTQPRKVGTFGNYARNVSVMGKRACIGTSRSIVLLDLTEPTQPKPLGEFSGNLLVQTPVPDLAISGDLVYVANASSGMTLVDFSDPTAPQVLARSDSAGYAAGICLAGTIAYIADAGGGLQIWDVANPSQPKRISQYATAGAAYQVTVEGTLAYVALWEAGMEIVDVRDPAKPRRVGLFDTPGSAKGIAVKSGVACIADMDRGVQVVEVSDPANPSLLGNAPTLRSSHALALAPPYAFLASGNQGLEVVDFSNPTQPKLVGTCVEARNAQALNLDGDHVYVASSNGAVHIVDISNPAQPVRIAGWETAGGALGILISNRLAYVATPNRGLQIADVSEPANPRVLSPNFPVWTTIDARDFALAGHYALIVDRFAGIRIFDVSEPTRPFLRKTFPLPRPLSIEVVDTHAYVALDPGNVITLDISDPEAIVQTDSVSVGSPGFADFAASKNVLLASGSGVTFLDTTDPSHPIRVGWAPTRLAPLGVAIDGSRSYMAMSGGGLEIIDFSRPSHLQRQGILRDALPAGTPTVQGETAFVVSQDQQFRTIDVSNPVLPRTLGTVDYPRFGSLAILVTNDHAFIAARYALVVADVANPTEPRIVREVQVVQLHASMASSGNFLYLLAGGVPDPNWAVPGGEGFLVFDISIPSNPVRLSRYRTEGDPFAVAVQNGLGYLADGPGGFSILDLTDPLQTKLIHRVPNIVNATGITLQNDRAYVQTSPEGIQIFDLTNPISPRRLGAFAPGATHHNWAILGNLAAVGNPTSEIELFDLSDPTHPVSIGKNSSVSGLILHPQAFSESGSLFAFSANDGLVTFALLPIFRSWTRQDGLLRLQWLGLPGTVLQASSPGSLGGWEIIPGAESARVITLPTESGSRSFRLVRP